MPEPVVPAATVAATPPAAEATPAATEPRSVEDIVSASVAALHEGDEADADTGDTNADRDTDTGGAAAPNAAGDTDAADGAGKTTAPAEGAAKPDAAAAKPADASKDANVNAALKEHGVEALDKKGKENRIPHSRVVKITESAVVKAKSEWAAKELAPVQTENTRLRSVAESIKGTEDMMFDKPHQFLALLNSIPGYAELLRDVKFERAATTTARVTEDPEPQPDVTNDKGEPVGWTNEGLAKWGAWNRRTAAAEATAAMEAKFKPITEAFDRTQKANERAAAATQTIDQQLNAAQTWPGFVENAQAILDALAADKDRTQFKNLQDAYNHVLFGAKNKAANEREQLEAEIRAKIYDELREAPRSTSVAGASSTRAAEPQAIPDGMDPTEAAIRRSIGKLA